MKFSQKKNFLLASKAKYIFRNKEENKNVISNPQKNHFKIWIIFRK